MGCKSVSSVGAATTAAESVKKIRTQRCNTNGRICYVASTHAFKLVLGAYFLSRHLLKRKKKDGSAKKVL